MSYRWRVCSDGEIPSDAFEAGREDGNSLYVARAYHEGDLIPGKLNPKHGLCYISWGGLEYEKREYWVLCGSNFAWEETSYGRLYPSAVAGGRTILGENLYIGLANHFSDSLIGKIHPSHKRCYVAYNGRELYYQHYKILTTKPSIQK